MGIGQIAPQDLLLKLHFHAFSCIFRIFCFGFLAATSILSRITCKVPVPNGHRASKGMSTLLIRTSVGRAKWKLVGSMDQLRSGKVFGRCLDIRSGEAFFTSWTPQELHVFWNYLKFHMCFASITIWEFVSLPSHAPAKYLPIPHQALRQEARGCGRLPWVLLRSHLWRLWRSAGKVASHASNAVHVIMWISACHFEWKPSPALHPCSTLCCGTDVEPPYLAMSCLCFGKQPI